MNAHNGLRDLVCFHRVHSAGNADQPVVIYQRPRLLRVLHGNIPVVGMQVKL